MEGIAFQEPTGGRRAVPRPALPVGPLPFRQRRRIRRARYGRQAIIITAQVPVGQWHDIIAEPTVADSILDRLLSNAHRLDLKEPSLRCQKDQKNM